MVLDKKPLTKNMRKTTFDNCVSILLIISNPEASKFDLYRLKKVYASQIFYDESNATAYVLTYS